MNPIATLLVLALLTATYADESVCENGEIIDSTVDYMPASGHYRIQHNARNSWFVSDSVDDEETIELPLEDSRQYLFEIHNTNRRTYTFSYRYRHGEKVPIESSSTIADIKVYPCLPPPPKEPQIKVQEKDFEIINPPETRVLKGNIQIAGNTILCEENRYGECILNSTSTKTNAEIDLKYVDIDSLPYTYNSSAATINIPPNATIKWAALFWQGYLHINYGDDLFSINTYDDLSSLLKLPIYFKAPFDTAYHYVYADHIYLQPNYNWYGSLRGYTYSAFQDITDLLQKSASEANGQYIVANIKSQEGNTYYYGDGLGNYGAWTLVILYENSEPTEKLRNLSVYEGYKKVDGVSTSDIVDITLKDFYTPTDGDVEAWLHIFVAEGDRYITGDQLYLNNKRLANEEGNLYNFFDSSVILPNQRTPAIVNNNGIDIHTLNVGTDGDKSHPQIITNNQSSANLKLTTSGDTYFPSMIAFSIQLYQPKICYIEELSTLDGKKIGTDVQKVNAGEAINVALTIRNDDNATAQDVKVFRKFDENLSRYVPESTEVQNVGKTSFTSMTDSPDDDLVTYDEEQLEINLGRDACRTGKGYFEPNDKAYVHYQSTVETDQNVTFSYTTSYIFTIGDVQFTYNGPLPKCSDFENVISGVRPDAFNVVNDTFDAQVDPLDQNDSLNALYTQVAKEPFVVKVLALKEDLKTLHEYSGKVTLYVVDMNDNNRTVTALSITPNPVEFSGESAQNVQVRIDRAYRNLRFKIVTQNGKVIYSRDAFSVKPQTFSFETNESYLIGAKSYRIDINSSCDGEYVGGYTQTIGNDMEKNGTLRLQLPSSCTTITSAIQPLPTNIAFNDGQASAIFVLYDNIGDVNMTLEDNEWTKIDQTPKSDGSMDCIDESFTNNLNSAHKVGCGIRGSTLLRFHPQKFELSLDISDKNANPTTPFTYISNTPLMSAKGAITIKALLADGHTATNYTACCFAHDINTTIELATNKTLSWSDTRNRIEYFDDSNATTELLTTSVAKATFKTPESNFSSGVATQTILFNFQRKRDVPDAPFEISNSDFNLSTQEYGAKTKGVFTTSTPSSSSHFLYARIHSPDESVNTIDGNEGDVSIYYEIYNPSTLTTSTTTGIFSTFTGVISSVFSTFFSSLPTSLDSVDWYINTYHAPTDGKIFQIRHQGVDLLTSAHAPLAKATLAPLSGGKHLLHLKYTGSTAPYTAQLDINASSWLIYDKYDPSASTSSFKVKFTMPGVWMGVGENFSNQDESNLSRHNKYRIEW